MDMNLSKLHEIAEEREAWRAAVQGVPKSGTWLSDWKMNNCCANVGLEPLNNIRWS